MPLTEDQLTAILVAILATREGFDLGDAFADAEHIQSRLDTRAARRKATQAQWEADHAAE